MSVKVKYKTQYSNLVNEIINNKINGSVNKRINIEDLDNSKVITIRSTRRKTEIRNPLISSKVVKW